MAQMHQQYLTHHLVLQMYLQEGAESVSTAVTGSKFVVAFKEHMFYAGMASAKQELILVCHLMKMILLQAVVQAVLKVDDTITGLKVFRDNLFIFCQNRIFKLIRFIIK